MIDGLHAWRFRGDPLADEAVAALMEHKVRADPLTRVRALAQEGDAACGRFVAATSSLPAFHDPGALAAGRHVALRHAPITFLVLLAGSLVESFAVAEGAAVLTRTGRLERDTERRIYETATLVRALLFDGHERPGGSAHEALLRVRLLHAFVRRWVTSAKDRPWDEAGLGVPVNQLDMLHTLLMFSHVVMKGLAAFGVRLTDEERASWCALWRLAGSVLGLDEALAFTNVAEEHAAYRQVRATYRPDDGSRALAHAVLGGLAGEPPFFLPKRALDQVARRLLDGDDGLADAFGLSRSRGWGAATSLIARAVRGSDVVVGAVPGGARVAVTSGRAFIEVNRWRVMRTMAPADYAFRTA